MWVSEGPIFLQLHNYTTTYLGKGWFKLDKDMFICLICHKYFELLSILEVCEQICGNKACVCMCTSVVDPC